MNEEVQVVDTSGSLLYQLVNLIIGMVELSLAFRFFLRLMGANPGSDFVAFIYQITAPLMVPFQAVFGAAPVAEGGIVEWSVLLAMLVYAVLGYLINELIALITTRRASVERTTTTVREV